MRTSSTVGLLASLFGARHGVVAEENIHAPYGVNFGSWLCLEDWFFSGKSGRYVSTPDKQIYGQGGCLPPGLPELTRTWSSEGELVKLLNQTEGPEKTKEYFTAHRYSYITASDFEKIASLGIRAIRVPLTWAAFADALAYIDPVYGAHNPANESAVVPDPFYADTHALVTVPRDWLAGVIRQAGSYGLKVLLDMHAMPGASSIGTYNGVWPARPMFWKENATLNKSAPLQDAGLAIAKALIDWVEGFDRETNRAVVGLTLMNEPGHLSASDTGGPGGTKFVEEPQILDWLAKAADLFRQSNLPQLDTSLYMNIIETAFEDFAGTVPQWFEKTFSVEERMAWAIADIHWYSAWSGGTCDGRVIDGGAYRCDDPIPEIVPKVQQCVSSWAQEFNKMFTGLKSCSEFSAGTYQDARYACNDRSLLRSFLKTQVTTMEMYDIQPIFWTWRMPYGSVFEPGWSLKHLAGLEDVTAETCNCVADTCNLDSHDYSLRSVVASDELVV